MYLYRGPEGRMMEEPGTIRVFLGSYVHSLSKDTLLIRPNGVIGVKDGKVPNIRLSQVMRYAMLCSIGYLEHFWNIRQSELFKI
jgi:hypothetical protein